MQKRIFIPNLQEDYIKMMKEFQIQKIKSLSKHELIQEVKDQKSWIYEIIKEDCINLFKRTGGFISEGFQDDDLYQLGVNTTIMQIEKRYFFDLEFDNILILVKIKSRISNNMKNYFSPHRKINQFQFNNYLFQFEDEYNCFDQIISQIDLERLDKETINAGLKKVWQEALGDVDFDLQDFKELCAKFDFSPQDILKYDPYVVPQMTMEAPNNSNYQLALVFDLEEAS